MTWNEFVDYQESTFESYCKAIIRNEGKNARATIQRRARHELNHSMYPPIEHPAQEDTYDLGSTTFIVCGHPVQVNDPVLGQALSALTPYRRNVILLFYFMDQGEPQIAALLERSPSTVNYQRKRALELLKLELEALGYGA